MKNHSNPLRIAIVSDSISFPHGMAATSRVKLLARAMLEKGAIVTVFCTRVSEFPPTIENFDAKGTYQGISFEYTPGRTTRSKWFLARRFAEIRGIIGLFIRLIQMKLMGQLDIIYAYISLLNLLPEQRLFLFLAHLLNVPVIGDFCEPPWILLSNKNITARLISPISGLKGAVAISRFLERWIATESMRLRKSVTSAYVPILVDIEEHPKQKLFSNKVHRVMFAGSPEYTQTISFIFSAMQYVWDEIPDCRLAISGYKNSELEIKRLYNSQHISWEDHMEFLGYMPRDELLEYYTRSSALLIPLFDDIRSQARFPTKIGEYLASGRPIITTAVGEMPFYFKDGQNAFMCEPGDPRTFAQKILEALQNPELADQVGRQGYKTAHNVFHYALYRDTLTDLFNQIKP